MSVQWSGANVQCDVRGRSHRPSTDLHNLYKGLEWILLALGFWHRTEAVLGDPPVRASNTWDTM